MNASADLERDAPQQARPAVEEQARPAVEVAVVMEREAEPNRWQAWRHRLVEVVPAEPAFGTEPRVLRDDGRLRRMLFPGFRLELFRDEAEGYHLNLSSGAPVWFVVWRSDDADRAMAKRRTRDRLTRQGRARTARLAKAMSRAPVLK